jgi:hypothetical protein
MASNTDWRGFVLALDQFSRLYILALLLTATWSVAVFVRVEGRRRRRTLDHSQIPRMARNLESLFGFSSILARALVATQIVQLCRYYFIFRATDGDVMSMLDEAWLSTQLAVCILLALSAMRWRASSIASEYVVADQAASSLK